MRKFLTYISILILFLSSVQELKAQVDVKIGTYQMCYGAATSMPVMAQNMIGVDSLRLVLGFNGQTVEYVDFSAKDPSLANGTFSITDFTDSIVISWYRTSPASIFYDTLLMLKFKGLVGSTPLAWIPAGSVFHTAGGNLLINFQNGFVNINPKINVLLSEIDPTCANQCDANYLASASGGTGHLTYLWNGKPGRFDSIQTGLCAATPYLITITDSKGCKLDSVFSIEGLPEAKVKIITEGNKDTVIYLENPTLTFSFDEISPTHVIEPPYWDFGDGDTAVSFNPTHLFSRANLNTDGYYDLKLFIKNENGCGDTITLQLKIQDVKLKIPNVMTPNADGFNDTFVILNENKTGSAEEMKVTTEFVRMELVVFDRWGRKIYDDSNYQSDWTAPGVPDGVYYFNLKTVGYYHTSVHKGSITVLGSGMKL